MHAEELAGLKTELRRRRQVVLETTRRAEAELNGLRAAAPSAEIEEGARVLSDEDALRKLGDAELRELARIDAAMERIEQGTYGTCADCGDEIEPRRLHALPHALRCQDCEELRERVAAR